MKTALVIGASGGIGRAVVEELRARAFHVVTLSRSADGFDVTDQSNVDQHLDGVVGPFDVIFVALGVLGTPEKSLGAINADAMREVFDTNSVGPALIMRHVARLLAKDGKCAVLSARVGSIGDNRLGGWYSYRASKAALNQIVHGAAIEIARSHKQACVVAMHPGTVATDFTARYAAKHKTVLPQEAAANLLRTLDGLSAADTGSFLDYAGETVPW